MEYYNKMICVTVEELTDTYNDEKVMSLANYKQLCARKRLCIARKAGGLGVYALVVYSSLPERFRKRFEIIHGNPDELLKQENMDKKVLKIDKDARDFYMAHILPNGKNLVDTKIEEYTINASVLGALIAALNERTAKVKSLGGGIPKDLWVKALDFVESYRADYNHTLPGKVKGLREKVNAYKRNGYVSLISGKDGNENTLKITEEAGNQIIALKRSMVPVYNNAQIFREYNRIALEKGWKPLKSINSLVTFLERPEVKRMWYDAVHGELAAHQKYSRKNKTILPSMRDSLWYADGTKVNLFYKAYDKDGKLKVCTTQVYEVMDAFSETMLGYFISDSENYEAQYNSFRMAIKTAGCRPYEIVTDNQGGHKKLEATDFFKRICHIFRFTAPYSGQSKTIESTFGRFQAEILHQDWRFTGQNITAKREESRPNLERVAANKESLYTLEELKVAYAIARDKWNHAKHPATGVARIEMYQNSVNPDTTAVDYLDMIEMFWLTTPKPSLFTDSGITITINKKEYTYEVLGTDKMPDLEFRRKNTFRKFYTMYDPEDMTQVRLYTKETSGMRYVATAEPYVTIHRNIQEQKPGEMDFIRNMDIRNKQERVNLQLAAAELETKHGVAPEQFGLNRPKMRGLSVVATENLMDKATKKAKPHEELVDVGLLGKQVSNLTFNDVALLDKY
ncbi:DDE-type integrase/transposase/recombinase [Parabacteroides faecis]|uniref:DDE-type integrase/transposase/recombinase n=1 Tax=Parabacteroides TaxID=375288 RepID=UPI000EFEC851|nr:MULTISPECIES: DDE-type integrase/transposase/recombinase [Parabacteroides]MBC8620724.1 DDE-type integrase/transposase/recombinase [Parabacteroides faecis]RHR92721.1 transposase [Parabacteroides sp. AF14-59]